MSPSQEETSRYLVTALRGSLKALGSTWSITACMVITGARWWLDRAEAVLKIRALWASSDFDKYWNFYKLQKLRRNHANRFQDPERLLTT